MERLFLQKGRRKVLDTSKLLELAREVQDLDLRKQAVLQRMDDLIKGKTRKGRPRMATTKKVARKAKGRAPKVKKANRSRRPNRETLNAMPGTDTTLTA